MSNKLISFTLILFTSVFLHSQNRIVNYKNLDVNEICTPFYNHGSFNLNVNTVNGGFTWPRQSQPGDPDCIGLSARFASGLWIGAKVGNDTLVAVAYYDFEYLPGYTDNNGVPHGANDPLYRVYKLYYGVNDVDRQQWPNSLLGNSNQDAPVYFDTASNSWRPLDMGNQTIYYVYTDSYDSAHGLMGTRPLKADIRQLNYALDLPGSPLNKISFSEFEIINRSTVPWVNAYLSVWTDDDLGWAEDDKVGVDSALRLGYTYNADDDDNGNYGLHPPAVGFLIIRGASIYTGNNNDTFYCCKRKTRIRKVGYRDIGLSGFNWITHNASCDGDPRNYRETYLLIEGKNRCGEIRINPVGNFPTRFVYSGDPVTGQGWVQPGNGTDERFIMVMGPLTLNPNDTQCIVVAQIIARGTSNLNSITVLRQYVPYARQVYENCLQGYPIGIEGNSEIVTDFRLYQNYPNPFNAKSKIKYRIAKTSLVSLEVYDISGRLVTVLVNSEKSAGAHEAEFSGDDYPSGVYFYVLKAGEFTESKKMVMIK